MALMLAAMIAFALHPPSLAQDRVFLAAYGSWAVCTDRAATAEAASERHSDEVVALALAACAADQEAVRRALIANNESSATTTMDGLLNGNRRHLIAEVDEIRRRAAPLPEGTQPSPPASIALAECEKRHVDAALRGGGPEPDIVDAALRACPAEEAAARAAALRMLGGDQSRADHMMIELRTRVGDALRQYISEYRSR